jgi:hypothetical protein
MVQIEAGDPLRNSAENFGAASDRGEVYSTDLISGKLPSLVFHAIKSV